MTAGPLLVQAGGVPRVFHEAFMVGRRENPHMINPLMLDDEYVSSPHARFWPEDGSWWVEDLGSTNGTYLGRSYERAYGPQRLRKGTLVRIGHTVLTVVPM